MHRRRLVINIGVQKIWGRYFFRQDSEMLQNFKKILLSSKTTIF